MTEQIRTLVVDDEKYIRLFLQETLQRIDHVVTTASDGEEALNYLRETSFDLAVVDLNLGGGTDGIKVLEAARWRWPGIAVVILTAHGSLESAMSAIREGVDGYLLKPAEPDKVRQTVRKALERRQKLAQSKADKERVIQRGPFFVDLNKHEATGHGQLLDLTAREFELLVHLMQNSHRVVPPPELVQVVRQYTPEHLQEARQIIKWYIHRLRQKVEPNPSDPRHILNVRGVGYRFVA